MSTWLLLLLLAGALFGLCMLALSLRQQLGLAPLMLVMGALEGLKTYVLTGSAIDLPGLGVVRVGSLVGYMNALTVVQVLYLCCGLGAARQLAWTLVCIGGALALLNPLAAALLREPGVLAPLPIDLATLAASGRIELVGNLLLLVGLLGGVVLVNTFQRMQLGRGVSLLLTLLIVASLDTLLFLSLAFGPQALQGAGPAVLGKALMAGWFSLLAYAYLRYTQGRAEARAVSRPPGRELLAALSFRGRLARLEQQLQTDPLTGVFNRRYLEQTVPELLHLDQLRGLPTSLLMLDLDHFKQINERHGHLVGDQALRHAAQRLQRSLRRNDVVLRYGGEEFLLLLPCTGPDEAERLGRQLLADLRGEPLQRQDGVPLGLSATAGLASAPRDGDSVRALLQRADERLRQGKQRGRDQLVSG